MLTENESSQLVTEQGCPYYKDFRMESCPEPGSIWKDDDPPLEGCQKAEEGEEKTSWATRPQTLYDTERR